MLYFIVVHLLSSVATLFMKWIWWLWCGIISERAMCGSNFHAIYSLLNSAAVFYLRTRACVRWTILFRLMFTQIACASNCTTNISWWETFFDIYTSHRSGLHMSSKRFANSNDWGATNTPVMGSSIKNNMCETDEGGITEWGKLAMATRTTITQQR